MSAGTIALPELHEERLAHGGRVVVAARPGVPLVAVRLLVKAGGALDPAGRFGLAHLVAGAARRGTARRTGDEVDELIESAGAELGAGADEDATWYGLSAPAEELPRLLDVLVDVVTRASFPAREVEKLRRRAVASLSHDLDEPGAVADRAMVAAAYAGHPYGHSVDGRMRDLQATRRSDAVAFHQRYYGPAAATLVVVGAVDPAPTLALARRKLAAWKDGAAPPPVPPPAAPITRRVLCVDKPDATQAQVRIALPALPRATPEFFAAAVANTIFGGGFTSRLMEAIRVNRGLSYGARSRFAMSRATGLFYMATFTKVETAAEVVEVALGEAARFREDGPTAEELQRAQSYLAGLYPLSLETHEHVAEKLADMDLYGIPADDVTGYREKVRAVTAEECREVARRHFPGAGRDDRGVVVVVGPARAIAPTLERFGPVTVTPARKIM